MNSDNIVSLLCPREQGSYVSVPYREADTTPGAQETANW